MYSWVNVVEGDNVATGDNSQIRTGVIERSDKVVTGVVMIRKWSKYVKKDEKVLGVTLDDVEFRPTKDGLSLPIAKLSELIAELQKIEKWNKEQAK